MANHLESETTSPSRARRAAGGASSGASAADILERRKRGFVLWRVASQSPPPRLVVVRVSDGAPLALTPVDVPDLSRVSGFDDLWELPVSRSKLVDGTYHYWFEVSVPQGHGGVQRVRITDPLATFVDWRVLAPPAAGFEGFPAGVVRLQRGLLVTPDAAGMASAAPEQGLHQLKPNTHLVLYELPAAWTRQADAGGRVTGVGSFRDVTAMIDEKTAGDSFSDFELTRTGQAYLAELGVTGLELLPPADSYYNRQWGYGTTNFAAPDFELGFPRSYSFPVPNRDLESLVRACHAKGIRFFADVVMAFSKNNPYLAAAPDDFFIFEPRKTPDDPDAHNSRGLDDSNFRDGFGSSLFRYARPARDAYDPLSGTKKEVFPARQLMLAAMTRWMEDFGVDGFRLDSIENVQNWDFIQQYRETARALNEARYARAGESAETANARFLVVGEELREPMGLIDPKARRLDGLWHERFKSYVRAALVGRNHPNEQTFEQTVRKALDCRAFGYTDQTEAIIYLTSHDVEGLGNERLFNFFMSSGVADAEKRTKLAFACLLTAVGVPMILAGDEFADQHDLFDARGHVSQEGGKQVDPVNFFRLGDDWRARVKDCVSRLIRLRTSSPAFAKNELDVFHVDFEGGKRVLAWRRGAAGSEAMVVVVANFSDYGTPDAFGPGAEYRVSNWPSTPANKGWREVTQDRAVLPAQVGREPIFPWEAKVYTVA